MTPNPQPSRELRRIEREAAAWLVRRDRGLTAAEQDKYFQWLAANPRAGEWLARHRQTWAEFDLLAEWKPENTSEPNPDLLALPRKRGATTLLWVGFAALAAAACLIVALVRPGPVPATPPAAIAAHGYERRGVEDGSIVELNHGASIEVTYSAAERHVRLVTGEASFTVAKNPARPFIVRAGGVDVRAVGTAFNVRLDQAQVHVLVTEGRVRVDDAAHGHSVLAAVPGQAEPVLSAGQSVTVDLVPASPAPVVAVPPAEAARLLAWHPEMLEFDATPLGEVVAAFNHRNTVRIAVADEDLLAVPIVASFRSDNVEGFVRLLELTAGVRAERSGDVITLRKAK